MKRQTSLRLCAIAIALMLSFAVMTTDTFWGFKIHLVFAADSYGNDIRNIQVDQYNGTYWNMVYNFTSTGGSSRIHDGWKVGFYVMVLLNYSLAASASDAESYTRVNCTITNMTDSKMVWNNIALNNTVAPTNNGTNPLNCFWFCAKQGNWTSETLPIAGVTYNCTFVYEAYY